MTEEASSSWFDRWVMRPIRWVGRQIAAAARWLCHYAWVIGIIVMIVGIGIAIFTSWTIAGIGAGAFVFIVGFVIFLAGIICRYA